MSMLNHSVMWALNDSGNGAFIYAMGTNGRDRGRVLITGAVNRDWEDMATFMWQGRAMILVADI